MLTCGSLFAGVGGFDIAAERAGMEVAWQSEVDKHASAVLEHHWPGRNLGDIHNIRLRQLQRSPRKGTDGVAGNEHRDIDGTSRSDTDSAGGVGDERVAPAIDVLCGGFPCQDYSVAGNREGLAGDRGALWWEFHRLIGEGRPEWVIGENVPGLLSSRNGEDFATIIESLTELGYGVVWAVLDAQYFGVAQRRRRVFIVGHSGGEPRPEILALGEGLFGHPAPSRETEPPVAALTANGVGAGGGPDDNAAQAGHIQVIDVPISFNWQTGVGQYEPNSVTVGTLHVGQTPAVTQPQVRRLTPLECERLQGFPDNWTNIPGNSDTQRYRQMGNAVAVPVVEWIMKRIADGQD